MTTNKRIIIAFPLLLLLFFSATGTVNARSNLKRSLENYTIPDVTLVNQDGQRVDLRTIMNSGKPVFIDFIYGTCTTICPILSIGFSYFQKKLGADAANVQLLSISIDPDNDTPVVMKEYLQRYEAQPGWDYVTGNREDIFDVLKALDAFVINKMNHRPVTIIYAPGDNQWVRIHGLQNTKDLLREYNNLLKE